MKLSDAYKIVKSSMRNQVPVMMWGPPGVGKSSVVHQIAEEFGYINKSTGHNNVVDLRLAQLEPTDLRGVPMPNRETGRAEWFLPAFWPTPAKENTTRNVLQDDGTMKTVPVKAGECLTGPGVIFLDEIEKAPVSVKNASLQLVLDRAVGSYKLPTDWTIVCAGNREEDGSFSQPLGSALANRMIHLEVEPDIDSWGAWARENNVSEDIIAFLYFKPELLYKYTDENAFPTPRSWNIGSNLISSVKSKADQKDLLAAAVGKAAAGEYGVWNNVYRNVNPEEVFQGVMPNFKDKDQSFKYAVALAVAFYLKKRKGGIKKAEENVAKFLDLLGPELRVVFLKQQSLQMMEAMAEHPAFEKRIREFMNVAV